jgi:MEMO1 family protein
MARAIQPSNLAGTWYPADPVELRELVEGLVAATRAPDPCLRAAIVPHAGYRYSGKAAATVYAKIPRGRWRRALVLAPSHYFAFGGAAVFPGDGFATPLGVARVERAAARALAAAPLFEATARPYAREHSLEIQLPFLQTVDPDLAVVPVLVGAADDASVLDTLARGVREIVDDETLVIVSSDFTHYGGHFDYLPFPPQDAATVARSLRELDRGAIETILGGDADTFARYVAETGITICGRGPISVFLRQRRAPLSGEVESYYTSLDVTGDYEHSVSYAAIAFRGAPAAGAS